jgi:hypothetical protein
MLTSIVINSWWRSAIDVSSDLDRRLDRHDILQGHQVLNASFF